MSVCITKNGNPYNKSNTGKVVASGVGAAVGGYWAAKNTHLIKQKINDIYVNVAKTAGKGALEILEEILKGNVDTASLKTGSKIIAKIAKYGIKFLNSIKKHPVAAGAITGSIALFGIGSLVDKNINHNRAKEADKK